MKKDNPTCEDCGRLDCEGLTAEDPSPMCVDWVPINTERKEKKCQQEQKM
jgi:hypothetical protein